MACFSWHLPFKMIMNFKVLKTRVRIHPVFCAPSILLALTNVEESHKTAPDELPPRRNSRKNKTTTQIHRMKMKTDPTKLKLTAAFWLATCITWLMMPVTSHAQFVLADFQDNTGDGCLDWPAFSGNGYNASVAGITNTVTTNSYSDNLPIYPNIYSFVQGAVPGYNQSLQITEAGNAQNLVLNLTAAQYQAFATNNLLSFTFSVPVGNLYRWLFANWINYHQLQWEMGVCDGPIQQHQPLVGNRQHRQ